MHEIVALFLQLNQNETKYCNLIYSFFDVQNAGIADHPQATFQFNRKKISISSKKPVSSNFLEIAFRVRYFFLGI